MCVDVYLNDEYKRDLLVKDTPISFNVDRDTCIDLRVGSDWLHFRHISNIEFRPMPTDKGNMYVCNLLLGNIEIAWTAENDYDYQGKPTYFKGYTLKINKSAVRINISIIKKYEIKGE